ncbi:MAG: 30S ribosome-binding factor RbfA [Firmicutes bacterium]|jgi:ribosome-binding factor A|nr:30S ribosome-binding factor RbfA [Bacillota bacterium]
MSLRGGRVAEAIKQEISDILRDELKDPRVGFASVTRVDVSKDLRHAKVFVSVLGDEKQKADTMEGLESATGFIRSEVGKRIRLHHTPEILFRLDESIERSVRIAKVLREQEGMGK